MSEAIGTVVSRPFAGSQFHRPAVLLDDGTWYWIAASPGESWQMDPGQRVRIRFADADQFCQVVEVEQ